MRIFGVVAILMAFAAPASAGLILAVPVPEPATLSVFAAGIGALTLLRRRKK